jgi:hypothetical protein
MDVAFINEKDERGLPRRIQCPKKTTNFGEQDAFEDQPTGCLLKISLTKDIDVASVFACRVLLDIRKAYKDARTPISEAFDQLRMDGAVAERALGATSTANQDLELRDGNQAGLLESFTEFVHQNWGDVKSSDTAILVSRGLQNHIKLNEMAQRKKVVLENLSAAGPTMFADAFQKLWRSAIEQRMGDPLDYDLLIPSSDMLFYANNNPIYASMESLRISRAMEILGAQKSNHFVALFCVSHLYNAVKCESLLNGHTWPALEEIMQKRIGVLFHGELPVGPQRCLRGFKSRSGMPASTFAKDPKKNQSVVKPINKKLGNLIQLAPVSRFLADYIDGVDSGDVLLANIHQLKKGKINKEVCTSEQLLLRLIDQVNDAFNPDIGINLVNLTTQCNKLLSNIAEALESGLNKTCVS